jgi:hypothetical protein
MHSISRLDSELSPEAPPPIAMPVPADFYFYKTLKQSGLISEQVF